MVRSVRPRLQSCSRCCRLLRTPAATSAGSLPACPSACLPSAPLTFLEVSSRGLVTSGPLASECTRMSILPKSAFTASATCTTTWATTRDRGQGQRTGRLRAVWGGGVGFRSVAACMCAVLIVLLTSEMVYPLSPAYLLLVLMASGTSAGVSNMASRG